MTGQWAPNCEHVKEDTENEANKTVSWGVGGGGIKPQLKKKKDVFAMTQR